MDAIGVLVTSFSAGTAIGALLGGALLDLFWWGPALLLNVPVMALLLMLEPGLLNPPLRFWKRTVFHRHYRHHRHTSLLFRVPA